MPCSRCGKNKFPLVAVHNKISKVAGRGDLHAFFKYVDWVCEECLTPKEKFLLALRDYNLQQEKKPETISLQKFQELKRKAEFECPVGLIPEECDGHVCPSKLTMGDNYDSPYDDYHDECVEALEARALLKKLLFGKVQVEGFSVRSR